MKRMLLLLLLPLSINAQKNASVSFEKWIALKAYGVRSFLPTERQ
jgi:hypothetical protein